VGHLAGLGHRVIAHLAGPPNVSVVRTLAEAVRASADQFGLDPALLTVRHCPVLTAAHARDATVTVLAHHPPSRRSWRTTT
jgi:DNA-binding LacI/PurR family transcriptional regulator